MKNTIKFIVLLFVSIWSGSTVLAQTVKIGSTDYATISEAIDAAVDGDVIDITGLHTETISIEKAITLRGTDPKTDIIQAAATQLAATSRVINIARATGVTDPMNVTIENLTIRYGNDAENGGGINVDKLDGLITLTNLIITENKTAKNGGGLTIAGSNGLITDCTIENNVAVLDGGGMMLVPNNAVTNDNEIIIKKTLVNANDGRNGGGLYLNGNKGFGNNHKINVILENTTVSNNTTTSGTSGAGGGGIWSKSAFWTGDNITGNVSLRLVHCTVFNNTHAAAIKAGIQFTSDPAGAFTNFDLYNSIIVSDDDVAIKSLNFSNSNTTAIINNIIGGTNAPVDSVKEGNSFNNIVGKPATYAGIIKTLSDKGGNVQVLALADTSNATNFCNIAISGITLPSVDARGITRDATPDAGAYEFTNNAPTVANAVADQNFQVGFASSTIDLSGVFNDEDGDALTYNVSVADEGVVTATVEGSTLTVTEVGIGATTVTITATDGNGGSVDDAFAVLVNNPPTVAAAIVDQDLEVGFGSIEFNLSTNFTDVDGHTLTYSASVANANVVTATITGTTLTITETGTGTTTVTVTADDGKGGTVQDEFSVTVGSNEAPVVAVVIEDKIYQAGFSTANIDFSATFTDADQDNLTYSVGVGNNSVVTAAIQGTSLIITEVGAGTTSISLTANDGNGGSVNETFNIKVNRAPDLVAEITDKIYQVGFAASELDVTDNFSDADSDALTFTVDVADENVITATVNGSTISIAEQGVGSTTITVTVEDGNGGSVQDIFNVLINRPPTLENAIIDLYLNEGFMTSSIDLSNTFADEDGDALTLSFAIDDNSIVTASQIVNSLVIAEADTVGATNITVTASDGNNGTASSTFKVSVAPTTGITVSIGTSFYLSISDAIKLADLGDTIHIRGQHKEKIGINKNLVLMGSDPLTDIIQAADSLSVSTGRVINISRLTGATDPLNVTLENLTVRYGKAAENGAGINADKLDGTLTLKNLIITENQTEKNGGGLSVAGSDALIVDCTFQSNTSTLDGGGIFLTPNNGVTSDSEIEILRSLIANNTGRNGGGIHISGNKGFGNDHKIHVSIVNTTVANNQTTSDASGNGGGGLWSKSAFWTGDNVTGNVTLDVVHSTFYNNLHASADKNGIQFSSDPAGALTYFSAYNSILVSEDSVAEKSVNFANSLTQGLVNNILGGLVNITDDARAFLEDSVKNNITGKTATYAGIAKTLSHEGGKVMVLVLSDTANAVNYCTATTGITLPQVDARGFTRKLPFDAGAFENTTVNNVPVLVNPIVDIALDGGFNSTTVDISDVFTDVDGDNLDYTVVVQYDSVVTATVAGTTLTLTEGKAGATLVTVTANDGRGGSVADEFNVTLAVNAIPVLAKPIDNKSYQTGFGSESFSIEGTFTDADGDSLTYAVSVDNVAVVTASFSGANLVLTEQGEGTAKVTLSVDDKNGGTAETSFDVEVGSNELPVLAEAIADKSYEVGFGTATFSVLGTFTDADGDSLIYSVSVDNQSVVTAELSGENLLIHEQGIGTALISLSVIDGNGGTANTTFNVIITDPTASLVTIGNQNYTTITEALEVAMDYDTIHIRGIHTESITIEKNITLMGRDPLKDIIQAAESLNQSTDRVISISRPAELTDPIEVGIINLGIRYGNSTENGGGINADKMDGLLTLINLKVTDNKTTKNGGGVAVAGSNALILDCTFSNNEALAAGGGVFLVPNNAVTNDVEVNIHRTLIAGNTAANGGGVHISGNKGFGNNHKIDVTMLNVTVANNLATSGTSGAGGGGLWSKCAFWTGDNTTGNITLKLIHSTFSNNVHSSADKNGIQFTSDPAGAVTNFSTFNSLIVTADDVARKSINFANVNATALVNNIFGGLVNIPEGVKTMLDDSLQNNVTGKTATFAGLTGSLTSAGGKNDVLLISKGGNAINYCTAPLNFEYPESDARGVDRDSIPDAGAVEYIPVNAAPIVANEIENVNYAVGFGTASIDLSDIFFDEDGDTLTYSVVVANTAIIEAAINGNTININEVGEGSTLVTITANDGNDGTVSDVFYVTVGDNNIPTISNPIPDISLQVGFGTFSVDIKDVFADEDGDTFSYEIANKNASVLTAVIENQSILLTEVGSGVAELTITVNDGSGGEISDVFIVYVGVNAPPVVANPITDQTYLLGFSSASIDLADVFTDLDDDPLSYNVELSDTTIVDVTIDQSNMILTEKQGGRLTLTLTADDQNGGTSSLSFDILVKPNSAPQVIASTNSLNLEQGFGTFTLDLSSIFFDEDGQMLTYDIAVIDSAVLAVDLIGHDLIITEQKSGATDIIIIANDGNEGVITYILKVKVSGLLGLDLQHAINVYPNPAIKIISVILPDGTESVHVDIMDINGRKWQVESKVTVEGLELDVMDLPSGVYIMNLLIDEISVYKRIIKN